MKLPLVHMYTVFTSSLSRDFEAKPETKVFTTGSIWYAYRTNICTIMVKWHAWQVLGMIVRQVDEWPLSCNKM